MVNILIESSTGNIVSKGKTEYKAGTGQKLIKDIQSWPKLPDGNPMQKYLVRTVNDIPKAKTLTELSAEEAAKPLTLEARIAKLEAAVKTK